VAIQIALGMLTLACASYAASELGFLLTAYLLQGIGAVSVLIGVVIFRDEIRRALTKASPLRLLLRRPATPERRDFTAVAEALFALARKRLGALVVVTRRESITEHLTGGVLLGARISEPLLEALFQKTSPLHDGATVIDGDRATCAGAFLPLARTELPVRYGTRHSAAVGLSEVSDALVIVVSEERGEVTIADGGALATVADASALSRKLAELVGPLPAPAPRPRRGLLRDAFVAALIFVTVVGAWNVVANRRDTVEDRAVTVELFGVPAGVRLEPLPAEVTLRLRGPRRLLVDVAAADLHAWADATAALKGAPDVPVSGIAPTGVEVVGIAPARAGILELRAARVEPQLVSGQAARVVRVTPDEVTLVGKVGTFKGTATVKTAPISAGSGVVNVPLVVPSGLRVKDPANARVEVRLTPERPR